MADLSSALNWRPSTSPNLISHMFLVPYMLALLLFLFTCEASFGTGTQACCYNVCSPCFEGHSIFAVSLAKAQYCHPRTDKWKTLKYGNRSTKTEVRKRKYGSLARITFRRGRSFGGDGFLTTVDRTQPAWGFYLQQWTGVSSRLGCRIQCRQRCMTPCSVQSELGSCSGEETWRFTLRR